MKKWIIAICLFGLSFAHITHARAQETEIAQLLLNLEKLRQFRAILKQMKQGYEILTGGYNTVINIAQGNFKIHQAFLDGLLKVSPAVRNYKRVADIIDYQVMLVREYKAALGRFRQNGNFNADELAYLEKIYGNLFKGSLRNLDELTVVITAGKLRMSDDERLKMIDNIFEDMQDKLLFLRHFNAETDILAIQRAKEKSDSRSLQELYGITN